MPRNLLILGASARAAAWSACRAGHDVVAGDLFADCDLREIGLAHRAIPYPEGLEAIAENAPPGPWFYTGGLENYPDLVDRIAATRTLWGTSGRWLREVRDPVKVVRVLCDAGLRCPDVTRDAASVPKDGSWLRKPLRSCGGTGVFRFLTEAPPADPDGVYYQRYIPGTPVSAVYVAAGGGAELLGVTRQLIGTEWSAPGPFGYAGSCGPVRLSSSRRQIWRRIGQCLSGQFHLSGLFGVDAIELGAAILPVEVNPRYTASVEILERSTGIRTIPLHAQASASGRLPRTLVGPQTGSGGKAILYAHRDVLISVPFKALVASINRTAAGVAVADIPPLGQAIDRGHPVVTVLADAGAPKQVEAKLREYMKRLRTVLG